MKILTLTLLFLFSYSCIKSSDTDFINPVNPPGDYNQLKPQVFSVEGNYAETWPKEWTQIIYDSLEKQSSSLLTDDLKVGDLRKIHCSNFNDLSKGEKKKFWSLFMASVSYYESSFNPRERYWETSMGKYSEGLLQLSVDDSNYYDFCELDKDSILSPSQNLACGISIMAKQVAGSRRRQSGELFPRSMFYWSVLTRSKLKNKVIRFFNKRVKKVIPICY